MKKINILLLLAVVTFGAISCNDELDLRSNGTTDMTKVFSDRNMTRGYLNSCYNYIVGPSLTVGSYTDDAQNSNESSNGSEYGYWYNLGLTSSNFGSYNFDGNPWTTYFRGIRKCNVFLENIDASTANITESEREGFKAQALTLRAYYYLQLMKRYGKVPLMTTDLGTTHDYSSDVKAPVSEIVAQILADCEAAIATPDSEDYSYSMVSNQWGIMTKAVAQAVRAETATWAISPLLSDGSITPEDALKIAADALKNLLDNDYSLWNIASGSYSAYASYFLYNPNDLRSQDKETIYGGSRVSVWSNCGLPIVGGQSSAGVCPTQDLVDAYEMANGEVAITGYSDADHLTPIINAASGYSEADPFKDRDPRFYATVFYNGSKRGSDEVLTSKGASCAINQTSYKYTHTGYYMRKYAHDNSNRNSNSDGYMRSMRLAEVYYNFAEISYQVLGPDTQATSYGLNLSAKDAVDAVRQRAGMPKLPSGLSAADFAARYQNDRRVEFALEADRYFSLRRWKLLSKTDHVTGMQPTASGATYTYERFRFDSRPTADEKYLLYPLELSEAKKMLELTGTDWQNVGW